MIPHRTPGEIIPDGPTPLKKGPAQECPACKARARRKAEQFTVAGTDRKDQALGEYANGSPLRTPRACTPQVRVKEGWFRRCHKPGQHLHEYCAVCGLQWLTAFAEDA